VAELQNAFRLARIQKSMLPHRFIGHGRPNVERLDGWPEIAHFGGKLFGQTLGDEDLLRRVERWYIAEHGGSHESFLRMKRTKLADLLRGATDPPTAEAGTPERQEKPKPKRKRKGRKANPERVKTDAEIAKEWASGKYHRKAELNAELGLPIGAVYAALERHRKRKPARKN